MRYLYSILFLLSCMPIYAINYVSERDSSIYVAKGNMQKLKDELIVSFELVIDRELSANESIALEPMVQDASGQKVLLPKIYINSRRQHLMYQRGFYGEVDMSNAIRRESGAAQRFHYLESLPYDSWMSSATLVVNEESCGCGLPVASDIAYTTDINKPYSLPAELPNLAFVMPEESDLKIRVDQGNAMVIFELNKTNVKPSFVNNQVELDKITHSIDMIKNDANCDVKSVIIHGFASPEGPYKNNDRLSKGRTDAIVEYVNNLYHFPDGILRTEHTAENWDGFTALLMKSSTKYKNDILKIIESDLEPDKKEYKIRTQYPQFFQMLLDDWFIGLRHTSYTVEYEVCFFNSVEEISQIYDTNPKNLSLNELYQLSQSYPEGSEERNSVLMRSVSLFPDDPVANLNAACVSLLRRDIVAARKYLALALDCGERDLASGLYYMLIEDYEQADYYLKQADNKGVKESIEYLHINKQINH